MKKLICAVLCAVLIVTAFPTVILAADCVHSFTEQHFDATCISKAHTTYTCSLCGYTYNVDDPLYVLPETGLYILATDVVANGKVTVTVQLGNNPGLWSFKMTMAYNPSAVTLDSVQKGIVFGNDEPDIYMKESAVNVCYMNSDIANITLNGAICTFVFNIIDENANWGFVPSVDSRNTIDILYKQYAATIVNAISAGNYADHQYVSTVVAPTCTVDGYTRNTCSVCGDTYTDTIVPALGHSWGEGVCTLEATLTTEGFMLYTCTRCGETKDEILPVLAPYLKGDLNGDGEVSSKDSNTIKRYIAGVLTLDERQLLAGDVNNDGEVSSKDSNMLKRKIAGYPVF